MVTCTKLKLLWQQSVKSLGNVRRERVLSARYLTYLAYLTLQGVPVFEQTSQYLGSPDGDYLGSFTHNGPDHPLAIYLRLHCTKARQRDTLNSVFLSKLGKTSRW